MSIRGGLTGECRSNMFFFSHAFGMPSFFYVVFFMVLGPVLVWGFAILFPLLVQLANMNSSRMDIYHFCDLLAVTLDFS